MHIVGSAEQPYHLCARKTINSPDLEIPQTTFPKPLQYPLKQWTSSTSSPSFFHETAHWLWLELKLAIFLLDKLHSWDISLV
jgi:hypothetical protein